MGKHGAKKCFGIERETVEHFWRGMGSNLFLCMREERYTHDLEGFTRNPLHWE